MDQAMSLNEIINRPEEFTASNPYYVVQHTHWIQCRYLFVRIAQSPQELSNTVDHSRASTLPSSSNELFKQDAQWIATGPDRRPVQVPLIGMPSAGGLWSSSALVYGRGRTQTPLEESDEEDAEDLDFVLEGSRFCPGTLDWSLLPRLKEPSYATNIGMKQIAFQLKHLQSIQSKTPLRELGWYINFDKIENMYHWIVELHSFDPKLPLANDMREQDITSVVLEIRFGRDFPMSPPFVRVVRPQFLTYTRGGGGHVTAGGAMCLELLTNTGWSPVSSLESVLMTVRMALTDEQRPARLVDRHLQRDYGIGEALEAYERAARSHGWTIPSDLRETATTT